MPNHQHKERDNIEQGRVDCGPIDAAPCAPNKVARLWWGALGLNQRPLACRLSPAERCADLHKRALHERRW